MFQLSRHPRSSLALALTSVLAPAASAQSFQGIGDLPGGLFESKAYGVSGDGLTILGSSANAAGTVAVYWRNGTLTSLSEVAGGPVEGNATGANFDGSIIVGNGRDAVAHRAVRWDGPAYTLTQLPQVPSFPGGAQGTGISASGQTICGWDTDNQTTAYGKVTGFRIDNGVITGLQVQVPNESPSDSGAYAMSGDGSVIVGRVRVTGLVYHGCYWVGSTLHLPPDLNGGADYSQTFGVSADGTVQVGSASSTAAPGWGAGEPCRWQNDVPVGLGGAPGGTPAGAAIAANQDGSVIVGYTTLLTGNHAFIWDSGHGVRVLADVLTNDYGLNLTGWTLHVAYAITPDGSTIVGLGTNPAGNSEGWIARLPGCAPMTSYCIAKTNALGCVPSISGVGSPSATATSGFVVKSVNMRNNKAGLLLYSLVGAANISFQGGTLCLASPIKRSTGLSSGGSPTGSDCTGVYNIDFNSFARGLLGGTPAAALSVPGTVVHSQFWGRDPGFPVPNNTQLSNGLKFTICN